MRESLILLVLLLTTTRKSHGIAYLPEELQERAPDECVAECRRLHLAQDEADDVGAEVGCGAPCRIDHCSYGCVIWEQALNSSCQEVCNGTHSLLFYKELYCTIGCQNALNQYFQQLKVDIAVAPAPSLVEESLATRSLTIKWDNSILQQYDDKILYFAQSRIEGTDGKWRYCNNQHWNENNQIFIYNLQSFTNYRFRLAIHLKSAQQNDDRPIVSQASDTITTFPGGAPSSAPVINKVIAIDHLRIYVNWKPGPFTSGPLFSYVLRLQQEGHETFQLRDIPISQDAFMFQNLNPSTNYTVTLTMRNEDGEGPSTSAIVQTLSEPQANSSGKPDLIIISENSIALQNADTLTPAHLLFNTTELIRDTALLISSSQLFLCDSSDKIFRVSIDETQESEIIELLGSNSTDLRPWALSIDWLNEWLYVAGVNDVTGYWEIARCDFDAKNLTTIITKIGEVTRLEVDPVNGYLFWMGNDGLYRVDLSRFDEAGLNEPEQILRKQQLGAFLVDYTHRRLLVAYQTENTIKSVTLDGKVVVDVRLNAKQPKFKKVISLAILDGLFYWTNGVEIFTESYNSNDHRYLYKGLFNRIGEDFVGIHILTSSAQPIPIPINPPTNLQILALSQSAKITWNEPKLLDGQSRGAWRDWSYALLVEDDIDGELIRERGLRDNEHLVDELREHALYSIKMAAYSSSGDGPWSPEFKVQTIKKELEASIIWATNSTLLHSDLTGENAKLLLNNTALEKENYFFATDLCTFKDVLYIVSNSSKLYKLNTTMGKMSKVEFVDTLSNLAIEWITEKIYWCDLKKQTIVRSSLNGSQQEPVVISGIVSNLLIDSLEAHVYWSTSRTVEVTRLNGEERRRYRGEEDFDGRHVAGLTLDLENRFIYWIIGETQDECALYRSITADMLPRNHDVLPELISTIRSAVGNSLTYISHRLFFLTSANTVMVTDVFGKYPAILANFTNSKTLLVTFTLKTPHPSPRPRVIVRPEPIEIDSIAIVGTWRDFNVTWKPASNTNYGKVFYEVNFADVINVDSPPISTTETTIRYANADRLLPYSLLEVTIRAYTHWDSASRVSQVLRSPPSVPSQPTEPRVFVESFKEPLSEHVNYFAIFRWNMPEFLNGPIKGFSVQCWIVIDHVEVPICDSVNLPATAFEYTIDSLEANTTHYFRVCAYAEVGAGPYTETITASTENENPIPQLLVAALDDVKKIDLDERSNITITRHIAVEVANFDAENKIFWINEMQELVTADSEAHNITKILTLNSTALSLCADWISRNLFWTESNYEESGLSHIVKLDVTVWEAGLYKYSRILSRTRRIVNLDIAPLTGNLFWIELISTSNLGYVMQSDLSGNNVQPFFNHTEDCTCPFRPTIQPVFTIDNTDPINPVIYWISAEGELYIADMEGCVCNLVLEGGENHGLPPASLTMDKCNIYWSNLETGKIYFTDKTKLASGEAVIKEYPVHSARSIRAIGKSLQPYPDSDCLVPQRTAYTVQLVSKTSTSISVKLPEPTPYLGCEKYGLPATLYTIDVADAHERRLRFHTYWRDFRVKDLEPFTEYRFRLSLANYYSDQEFDDNPEVTIRTGAGVPSKPQNVKVQALTPTLAMVSWESPAIWNAEFLRYKVVWVEDEKDVDLYEVTTLLSDMVPGKEYAIHVRAYPENLTNSYSQSEKHLLRMYSEPDNVTLTGVNAQAMNLSWLWVEENIVNCTLEFTISRFNQWQAVTKYIKLKNRLMFFVDNLEPKESYKFRLVLKYKNHTEDFYWPEDGSFIFETLEDLPTIPGPPTLITLPNSNYQLLWRDSTSLHPETIMYFLEGTIINSSYENLSVKWFSLYNGSDTFWNIPQQMQDKYQFRVRARNERDFGNWSESSSIIDLTEMTRAMIMAQEHLGLILGLSVPAIAITLLCFCYCLCPLQKKTKEEQKKVPLKTKPNVELATLREIPRGNFVETNALYVAAIESDSDDSLLPKIQREQISLNKFLGSGAFGEVFQGIAKDLDVPGSRTPIAIKTLRKGASAQEKSEFLQEAKLMSHFQHKHVLRLLGVCLDSDTPLLLLELMAGGDLLSYLRTSRSLKPSDPSALRLQDLLSMCEDVARGCRYLEELHFVHRDLACRNCLVSAREREQRVVKIGDFGLARDIYKNDYYRKEGEGLLPVRWMAPESLVDGVFTSQSDVWAFGVLMWEITSLGQQPYQARTNFEVLHHVRAGGRLPKPLNCPTRLHQLMLKCWSAPDARPSFKVCLDHIVVLRNNTEDCTLSPVNPGHFLVHGNSYKSTHFRDNLSIHSLLQDSDNSKPALTPKYSSWHVSSSHESKDPRAAYEVPKSIPVVVEPGSTNSDDHQPRYIEVCSVEDTGNRTTSVTSLNLPINKTLNSPQQDKRSSSASLGEKFRSPNSTEMKQSGSYARLVGNGESVNSLSDWRRVKNETSTASAPKLHRSKSSLQNSRANIPLVINSALLNMLRQESGIGAEDDDDEDEKNLPEDGVNVNYANIRKKDIDVTDL
ncbi:proto-oncogene tyrosine-protein kinase ROS [Phymastichus coffea]|uniref:proto-oncogene tyrosine-protein kinase ROS n=1 Tax=Phymastichus coffea TaxID=108790 RepID=UPI00273C31AB|nr:proto-oncogene tyrosine-protein kinase ROS [Phymastichus coffea]